MNQLFRKLPFTSNIHFTVEIEVQKYQPINLKRLHHQITQNWQGQVLGLSTIRTSYFVQN